MDRGCTVAQVVLRSCTGWVCMGAQDVFLSIRFTISQMVFHIFSPRSSIYLSGYLIIFASERRRKLSNTTALASDIAFWAIATAVLMFSSGASIKIASCTGAQTRTPLSMAKQQAKRSISDPLPCMGKLRRDLGLGLGPMCIVHPKVV